ncbi:hypothetical protein KC343_g725 [Hortaea werneckii]|uniref:Cytochrome P450 n=1 Tax=Hortaea werneckii TaxID=91943 RepID=A0A3M7FH08_HORWE|nr:hypothetical protein KC338_g1866 [Hortaea werneckii]KAI7351361.1 hypothetical protein KC320_g4970 [Hortaea werneckii]KAI7572437.1 hypothetical protein KC317_g757 [Hortaea werneckii]KAI7627527.1 hypothetical protein KC346_g704 [Hortaea werneckii]KAI7637425.1 hypothetical protein KC343_g725 [Hortaea werneckii]
MDSLTSNELLYERPTYLLIAAGCIALIVLRQFSSYNRHIAKIPASGYPPVPFISSWIAAVRFMRDPVGILTNGIDKFRNKPFRIATLQGEYVIITSREQVAEYIRVGDDVLNMLEAADDQQQIQWTMGYGVTFRPYHSPVVRTKITKCLDTKIPVMAEEMQSSFTRNIGSPTDYTPVTLYEIIALTVASTSNRVFVGEPLSSNYDYLRNAVDYAAGVVLSAEILRVFPDWTKKYLVKWAPVARYRKRAIAFLGPIIKPRLESFSKDGTTDNADLIDWLIEAAPPVERNVEMLVERVMALNVASIHTTTMNFTYAMYRLAQEPEKYMPELRSEASMLLSSGTVTREAINKMAKTDSFLREASRLGNDGLLATQRNAKKPFTFADGTVVPAGGKIGTPLLHIHRDPAVYDNPDEFDGFRFYRGPALGANAASSQPTLVTTDASLQIFGHGRHACPGRFFAATEMKLMFAILVSRYDVMLAPGTGPKPWRVGTMSLPDTELQVFFREKK